MLAPPETASASNGPRIETAPRRPRDQRNKAPASISVERIESPEKSAMAPIICRIKNRKPALIPHKHEYPAAIELNFEVGLADKDLAAGRPVVFPQ